MVGPPDEVEELIRLSIRALRKYLDDDDDFWYSQSNTTLKGELMANYPLNTLDSVVVSLTATDDVTGLAVTIDPGSVVAVLSNPGDSVVVDPSGTFLTITAGGSASTGNTVTITGTVNGVASGPVGGYVGTYDDVVAVTPPDATTLSATFSIESAPVVTGLNPPLTAAQTTALVAAGLPYVSAPLSGAQLAALTAAGLPWTAATLPILQGGTTGTTPAVVVAPSAKSLASLSVLPKQLYEYSQVTGNYEKVVS